MGICSSHANNNVASDVKAQQTASSQDLEANHPFPSNKNGEAALVGRVHVECGGTTYNDYYVNNSTTGDDPNTRLSTTKIKPQSPWTIGVTNVLYQTCMISSYHDHTTEWIHWSMDSETASVHCKSSTSAPIEKWQFRSVMGIKNKSSINSNRSNNELFFKIKNTTYGKYLSCGTDGNLVTDSDFDSGTGQLIYIQYLIT